MKIEFDAENSESIIHLGPDDLGTLLFGLEMATHGTHNPAFRLQIKLLLTKIRQGLDVMSETIKPYTERDIKATMALSALFEIYDELSKPPFEFQSEKYNRLFREIESLRGISTGIDQDTKKWVADHIANPPGSSKN